MMSWGHTNGSSAVALSRLGNRRGFGSGPANSPSRKVAPTGREEIKDDIEAKCRSGYKYWRIGLTHNLLVAKDYLGGVNDNVMDLTTWTATSLLEARKIEQHFISSGMQSVTREELSFSRPVHVFVFWVNSLQGGANPPASRAPF